jgi:hypothetical protein
MVPQLGLTKPLLSKLKLLKILLLSYKDKNNNRWIKIFPGYWKLGRPEKGSSS